MINKEEKKLISRLEKERPYKLIIEIIEKNRQLDKYKSIISEAIHLINHNDILDYRVFEKELLEILIGSDK